MVDAITQTIEAGATVGGHVYFTVHTCTEHENVYLDVEAAKEFIAELQAAVDSIED